MSRHHRNSKHTTHAPAVKRALKAALPLRCLDCPHPVLPEHEFQVAHRTPAMQGGRTTIANAGASHKMCPWCKKRCNQVAGGKMGAAVTNSKRQAAKDIRAW